LIHSVVDNVGIFFIAMSCIVLRLLGNSNCHCLDSLE